MNKKLKHIALAIIGLVAVNLIANIVFKRFDLTSDKRYTLSEISKHIVDKVDNQLIINIYLEGEFPSEFQRLQTETRQFLEELQAENSNIHFRFINPDNQRERLIKQGMYPSQLTVEEDGKLSEAIIFPYAKITYGKQKRIVSLLPNIMAKSQEEQLENAISNLEFSFAEAINSITQKKAKKIAVLSGNGELDDMHLYSFLSVIGKKYRMAKFTLDSVAKNPQKTLNELQQFDLAIIAKPTERFSDEEKLTLDQFIANGGRSLWMLDTNISDTDSLYNQGKMLAYPRDLNLTDLLFNYGVRVNHKLIKDLNSAKIPLATGNVGNQAQFQNLNWFYHPLVLANPNHAITKNVMPVRLRFATQIDTLQNKSIKKTPLLMSSILTKKVGTPTIIELKSIAEQPQQNDYNKGNQLFAVLLEGKFKSAYKDRTLVFDISDFKTESSANKMVVIADGDIAKNQILKGKPFDLGLDKWTQERFGNKDFLLNTVDYLLDDSGLINLRNKTVHLPILNKGKVYSERRFWQFFNIVIPLVLLVIFGFGFNYFRRKKYEK